MPAKSEAQNRWAHWRATHGTPSQKALGREFINNASGLPPMVHDGKAENRKKLVQHLKKRKH